MVLEVEFEAVPRLDRLGRKLRVATQKQVEKLTDILYDKVQENLSGKILQKRTGELARSIQKETSGHDAFYFGTVFVDKDFAKAGALEKGGKGAYPIVAKNAPYLHFFWTKEGRWFRGLSVNHPPSKEFAYLRLALEESAELIPEGFRSAISAVLFGGGEE